MDTKELDLLLYKLKIEFSKNSNQALIETETYSQIIDLFTKQAGHASEASEAVSAAVNMAWHPLDHNGLRLYQVHLHFINHPEWNKTHIVAATRPMHAEKIINDIYKDANWIEQPIITKGLPLNILMPTEWWTG